MFYGDGDARYAEKQTCDHVREKRTTFIAIQNESFVLLLICNVIIESQVGLMTHWQPAT